MDRVTQRLGRGVEGTSGVPILPMPFAPFQPPKPTPRTRHVTIKCVPQGEPCSRAWVAKKLRTASTG